MRKAPTILLTLLVCGCTSFKPPAYNAFITIALRPYEIHVYDCSNKCADYAEALIAAGYPCEMVIVDDDDKDNLVHAILKTVIDGQVWYLDVTNFKWSRDIKKFGEFLCVTDYDRKDKDFLPYEEVKHLIKKSSPVSL